MSNNLAPQPIYASVATGLNFSVTSNFHISLRNNESFESYRTTGLIFLLEDRFSFDEFPTKLLYCFFSCRIFKTLFQ